MFQPSSVLLIKLRHHGDVLLTTPVARTLKTFFPKCQIDFLVYEGTEEILKNNPDVRDVWIWHRTARGSNYFLNILQLFFHLRSRKYDLVIHLSDQMQGALLAKFLAPKRSIGIDYPKRRNVLWRSCFSELAALFPSNTHHTVEQNLATLEKIIPKDALPLYPYHGTEPSLRCRLVVSEEDRFFIKKKLEQLHVTNSYLLIHPTARWFFKCWEEESFASVMHYFTNQGWTILVTSGPSTEEKTMVDTILQKVHSPRLHSLAGQLTLGQLAAAIDGATLFIGVDSVPMHMAAALEKDVLALFGPSKINEWHPWMTRYHLLKASDYAPLLDPDHVKTETTERYLTHIPVEAVITAIESFVEKQVNSDISC